MRQLVGICGWGEAELQLLANSRDDEGYPVDPEALRTAIAKTFRSRTAGDGVAALGPPAGVAAKAAGQRPVVPEETVAPPTSTTADLLAELVRDQWTRAAGDRRLLHPEPIPVRWGKPAQPLAGPVSAAANSQQFSPLPGLSAVTEEKLRQGGLQDLHGVYGGLGSGRMIIAGAPGSGKSGTALLLVLAALKHREQVPAEERRLVPVPVIFTLHGWNPGSQRFQDWLAHSCSRPIRYSRPSVVAPNPWR